MTRRRNVINTMAGPTLEAAGITLLPQQMGCTLDV